MAWAVALLLSATAVAQPPADEPTAEAATALAYSAVDRATVRVYAVRNVTTGQGQGSRFMRTIALPEAGHGSGVVVGTDGLVLTAHHVVQGARFVAVRVPGEPFARAAVPVVLDEDNDVALLAVPGTLPSSLEVPSAAPRLRVRQTVDAIGYPLDPSRREPQSSRGIISGVLPSGELQLDIALNPGNSGGPLVDESETLIGMVIKRGDPSQGVQGIGVAVPPNALAEAIREARADGRHERARSRFETGADQWCRLAFIVDALLSVGALGVIRDIVRAVDNESTEQVLNELERASRRVADGDLKVLIAAVFWNAAAALMERGGGRAMSGTTMARDAPNRDTVIGLENRARELCAEAVEADREIRRRSPFALHLTSGVHRRYR